jgi:ketosteroid isomerase-like protein
MTPSREVLVRQVTDAEDAFAKTMADRDHAAFMRWVADDAVFLNGGKPLRGKAAIGEYWKRFYAGPTAPFSWKPDLVEVVGTGNLAQSIGPVLAPSGKTVARFYSTWRLEPAGNRRVVLDDGYDVCDRAAK